MKSVWYSAILSLFLFSCHFQDPENKSADEKVGVVYGSPFDYSKSITAADLIPVVNKIQNDTVVSGKIESICDNGKCVTVAMADSVGFIIKWNKNFTLDNEFINKMVLAYGHAYRDTTKQKQYIFESSGLVVY